MHCGELLKLKREVEAAAVPIGALLFRGGGPQPVPETVALTARHTMDEEKRVP